MKKVVFAGAAVAALMMAGAAHAEAGGYAGVLYNDARVDEVGDNSGFAIEGGAAFGDAVAFEVDGMLANADDGVASSVTGHVYKRTDRFLAGAYAGYTDNEASTTEYGVEANFFMDRLTIAAAYATAEAEFEGIEVDAQGYSIEARLFPNDHIRLQVGLGSATADVGYFSDVDFSTWGGGMEFQIGDTPLSGVVSYANADVDDLGISIDTVTVGLRYNWGGSLFERDRSGASQGHASVGANFVF